MDLFSRAYKQAKHSIWRDCCPDNIVFEAAQIAFKSLSRGCTFGKRLFRITGQSGSGKTSQLLGPTMRALNSIDVKPMHIAVRKFAKFYPFAQDSADPYFREKSNGFCLKVLICVLKKALDSGVDILLEIALLDKSFEKFVFESIKKHDYLQIFQIMCVNKLISSAFIAKRERMTGRITSAISQKYFFSSMLSSLKYVARKYDCPCVIWTAYDMAPVYCGRLAKCKRAFFENLKRVEKICFDEQRLQSAKFMFLLDLFRETLA